MNTKSLDSEKITQMCQLPPTNKSVFISTAFFFIDTDNFTVVYPQTDFEKDVDIACRSGKEQTVSCYLDSPLPSIQVREKI